MMMRRYETIHGATRIELVGNTHTAIPYAVFIYGDPTYEASVFIEPKDLLSVQRQVNDAVAALRAAGAIRDPTTGLVETIERVDRMHDHGRHVPHDEEAGR